MVVALVGLLPAANAFVPANPSFVSPSTSHPRRLYAEADEKVQPVEKPPVEPGTHEELMYALGVNLARQLGDIRPLVENGEELATVAKGLLDTVIGRLTDEGQRALLATRGKELNQLIAERA